MSDMLMSFEVRQGSSELDVFLDREGLHTLLSQLAFLDEGKTDHIHLMAESWGGHDLAETPIDETATPLRHVKVRMVQNSSDSM